MQRYVAAIFAVTLLAVVGGVEGLGALVHAQTSSVASASEAAITSGQAESVALGWATAAGDTAPLIVVEPKSLGEADMAMHASAGAAMADPDSRVYLVTMRGDFTFAGAHVPRGRDTPKGNTLQIIVSMTGFVLGLHLGNE